MRYPKYLEVTSPEERTFNYWWSIIHGLKQAYWQTPKDERPDFLRDPAEIRKARISLNEMIEKSLEMQREKMAKKRAEEAAQAAQNGTLPRRKGKRGHLKAVPGR